MVVGLLVWPARAGTWRWSVIFVTLTTSIIISFTGLLRLTHPTRRLSMLRMPFRRQHRRVLAGGELQLCGQAAGLCKVDDRRPCRLPSIPLNASISRQSPVFLP